MPQRNLAVELLQKLLKGEIRTRRRRNVVQARSFADLLEQAIRTTADFSMTVTQPVVNAQNQRIGFVVLEQGMPQLQAMFDTLPLPAGGAYAELQQKQDGKPSILMRRGNQALKSGAPAAEVALTGTPWKIMVWRNQPPGLQVAVPYVFAWVLLTLAIAVIVMGMMIRVSNRVALNLKTMARMINDMRLNKLQETYPISLAEFARPMRAMLKIAHYQAGQQKKVTSEATLDHLSKVHTRRSFEMRQSELHNTVLR